MEREGAEVSALRPRLEARGSSYGPEDPGRRAFPQEGPAANSHTKWTYKHALIQPKPKPPPVLESKPRKPRE